MWKFLRTEMLVILAMTENVNRTDGEIADAYGLKQGTVSSIRRRLLDAGAINYVYVPAFNRLGCEIIGFHYGATDPAVRPDIKSNHYMEFCNRTPQIFHALIGGNSVIFYTALRNATELEAVLQQHNTFFAGHRRSSKAKLNQVMFPYSMTRLSSVPQFAPLVHSFFKPDVPPPKGVPVVEMKRDPIDLSASEKKTFSAMVSNPSASDREIADMVKLSRQAVTRMRNKYEDEGLLTRICVPKLYRWGFEIYTAARSKFSMDLSWDKRMKNEPREVIEQSFFTLSKADESVANFMVSKFTEYSAGLENMMAWYHKLKVFEEPPELILFPLERSTELRTFEYSPAVSHLFQQDLAR